MRYLNVKNWADFQHYKKRSPPWIKLHRAITDDYAFGTLRDETKAHLILIWILAAATDGRIPHDAEFLAKRINAQKTVDLDAIIGAGFLIPEDGVIHERSIPQQPLRVNGTKITFDGAAFVGITDEIELRWQDAYPAVPIPPAIAQAAAWLTANPANRKSNYERFLVNWFKREQDRAARVKP